MSHPSSIIRIKLPHQVIVKSPGLLPMLYTARELASELNMPERTLRDWLRSGAPYTRDARQHIWINGQDFAHWVDVQRQTRRRAPLANDEAFCLRCNRPVKLYNPVIVPVKGKLLRIRGTCPICNSVINRGGRSG